MFVKEKRENILQSFGGIFHFQHGIFNFSYLFIYLIYLFDMGYVCVCVCVCVLKMCLGKYYGTQTLFFLFFPFKFFFLKKKGNPFFLKQAVTSIWHENMWGFSWPHAKSQQCNAMHSTQKAYHFVVELFTTTILGLFPSTCILSISQPVVCGWGSI